MLFAFRLSDALPPFILKDTLKRCQEYNSGITSLTYSAWLVASCKLPLSLDEKARLLLLADAKEAAVSTNNTLWVTPRIGTSSAWSSKAQAILSHCGLNQIERVEKFHCYQLNEGEFAVGLENPLCKVLHDPMLESVFKQFADTAAIFKSPKTKPLESFAVLDSGVNALASANKLLGLALSSDEMAYLAKTFKNLGRDPFDVELMMFAQANSEHCRHKIFNANWTLNGKPQPASLFSMIKNTFKTNPNNTLVAYHDNAAIFRGSACDLFKRDANSYRYHVNHEPVHTVIKVETHNHPTAISPFPGAATGTGGEIRDEAATGRGAKSKAGLVGFATSNLKVPGFTHSWEEDFGKPDNIASALDIMLKAPIGSARYGNEFGRPTLCGFFRTLEQTFGDTLKGYHKPMMIAGGSGAIREPLVKKLPVPAGAYIIVLGGPGLLIGLGGGAASSVDSTDCNLALDFASVQRDNAEIQRRAQQVIDYLNAEGDKSPVLSIHDVGAGGLSNAVSEILHDNNLGGVIELRDIPIDEPSMSPMEIWCNEAQERYVLAIMPEKLPAFKRLCARERCTFAVIGKTTSEEKLILHDKLNHKNIIDLPMDVLFKKLPKLEKTITTPPVKQFKPIPSQLDLTETIEKILTHPTVASKLFLITIGDRNITGLVAQDQLIGPWQIPVADCAITQSSFMDENGEAMAVGERPALAMLDPIASGRMALSEAITNIAAAPIKQLSDINLSANWMAACGDNDDDHALFQTVKDIGLNVCPALGINIPVGKDSLSMRVKWADKNVSSPLSLVISAFAPVYHTDKAVTPLLNSDVESVLLFIDLGQKQCRQGGSILSVVTKTHGSTAPNLDNPKLLKLFFEFIQKLIEKNILLAYHDKSDGGLFATLCEMMFAARVGLSVNLDNLGPEVHAILFNEELGAVIQVPTDKLDEINDLLVVYQLSTLTEKIGTLNKDETLILNFNNAVVYQGNRIALEKLWSKTSFEMRKLRDNPICASEEYETITSNDTKLCGVVNFDCQELATKIYLNKQVKPKIAILREQGINGHLEMAAAFYYAGFETIDVTMQDLLDNQFDLINFDALVACGGFSYGDVLGAGQGWAKTILLNDSLHDQFQDFFHRKNTLTLGVCNGCQMLSSLKSLIPGANHWPRFTHNASEQFESRLSMVRIPQNKSILFADMQDSYLPITLAHGEGRAVFATEHDITSLTEDELVTLQYVTTHGKPTEHYPENPNGSPKGITGLTNKDGRVSILMPHPERIFRSHAFSFNPVKEHCIAGFSPWFKLFLNARKWFNC